MVGAVHRTARTSSSRACEVNRPLPRAVNAFEKAVGAFAARRKFCRANALL